MEPRDPEPVPPGSASPAPDGPFWARVELAWPLSLLAGFGGSWVGLLVGVPGAAALGAFLAFLPVHNLHCGGGNPRFSALLGLGWAVGILGAILGSALEGGADGIGASLPLSSLFVERGVVAWFGGPGADAAAARAGVWVLPLLLARPARGLAFLLLFALAVGAAGAGAGWVSARAAGAGVSPLSACALGLSPFLLLEVSGTLAVGLALAEPLPLRPFRALGPWRRGALGLGAAAIALGIVLEVTLAEPWAAWVDASAGLR